MKPKHSIKQSVLFTGSVLLIILLLFSFGFFQSGQDRLTDTLFTAEEPLDSIIIIAIDDKSLQEVGRWPWDRQVYIDLFEQLEGAKAIGLDVAFFEQFDEEVDAQLGDVMRSLGNVVIPMEIDYTQNTILLPTEGYENIQTGFVNVFSDKDGLTRKTPLLVEDQPAFAFAIYQEWRGKEVEVAQDPLRINFIGPPFSFETLSFSDALKGEENYADKIVLIGATAPDLHDDAFVPTSSGRAMPGVEIHANTLQTLITKNYLTAVSPFATIVIMFLFSLIVLFSLLYLRLAYATPLVVLVGAIYIWLAITLFDKGIILNMVYPLLTLLFSYLVLVAGFYVLESIERQRVKNIFGKYVSPHLAEHILETTYKDEIHLDGEEKYVALLFADIRGFTAMSETMKPREVVNMLNSYLGAMTRSVFDNNGTLDKYMGDCIMAIFGAPFSSENPTLDAIKCALDMQKLVKKVSDEGHAPKIGLGIGINFGEAIVGNMGSKERAEYTAIGDTVNTASRMCSAAEGTEIKLPKESYEQVKDLVKAHYVGEFKVKGKVKPIKVYEVDGLK